MAEEIPEITNNLDEVVEIPEDVAVVDTEIIIPSLPNPIVPLQESYTWHSPMPTTLGPYILGVDEAGRGPVLGPLVYGIAYCAESWEGELDGMGFAGARLLDYQFDSATYLLFHLTDSKTLTAERRSRLLSSLCDHPEHLGWSVNVLSYVRLLHLWM